MICQVLTKCCVEETPENQGKKECSFFLDGALAIMFLTLGILAAANNIRMSPSASYALLGVGIICTMHIVLEILISVKQQLKPDLNLC